MRRSAGNKSRAFAQGAIWVLFIAGSLPAIGADSSADGIDFFEKKIRPVLVENCHKCHSAQSEKLKGGLLLDSREGVLKGGETGPAVILGDAEKSLLIKAVRYADKELQMPPKNKKLPDRQIADLTTWVKMGAPWPPEEKSRLAGAKPPFAITDSDRAYWAFCPIKGVPVPAVKSRRWAANGLDAFLLAELEAKGLNPNPPATKRELIRRVYFDLIGLPPAPEEVAAFETDQSPDAWEKLIDHLLSLPQYGERWARHWLDVVRFAQSNGYERDGEKPFAWRYRDYVIKAFNEDRPYDRFIKEQLAGDELPDVTIDSIVATGFQRIGVWDDEPDDKRMAEFDELDDIISTTSTAFLGLTIGCARCHDHKFDPISQIDYYQFLSFFRNVRSYENAKYTPDSANFVALALPKKIKEWQTTQGTAIAAREAQLGATKDGSEKKQLEEQLKKLKADAGPFEWALAVRERGPKPIPTHLLVRGNAGSPAAEVQPGFLTVLGGKRPVLPARESDAATTGRRLALAEWIASPENPLTARVMVNRIWQHHFGKGIVKTTTDFGRAGVPPTNPKLLDWLAARFIDSGWSMKKMHKLILLSNAYRMSSRSDNSKALAVDPGNDLLWRQNLRRLEAEVIHDSVLEVSGDLNLKPGGRGFFPHLTGEVLAGASRPGLDWQKSVLAEDSRRSIYTYIRRTMLVPTLETFDYSNTASPLGERPVTTVAPQALMLLNDDFMQREAGAFAERLRTEAGQDQQNQIRRGYQRALGRDPAKREMAIGLAFLNRQAKAFHAIESRLTFRPDVPTSLSVDYMNQLHPADFLIGPSKDWSYHRGQWSAGYEGIRTVERQRGPFALWTRTPFADGVIEARLVLDRAAEFGSILLRATADGDLQRGYEVTLDPRQQRLALRRHTKEMTALTETAATIPAARPILIKVELAGPRIRIWLNDETAPKIDLTDSSPILDQGLFGIRTWGAALSIDELKLPADSSGMARLPERVGPSAEQGALQSFCLMLLNLNESIYVD